MNRAKFRSWHDKKTIIDMATTLRQGNVIISSTDTVLGFLSTVSQAGYTSLNRIKKRTEKPYLILISDKSQLDQYIQTPLASAVQRLIDMYWPGPLTIIFNAKPEIPDYVKSSDGTVAIRLPDDPRMRALVEKTGPLFSTSANLSGQPIPNSIDELDQSLVDQVAYVAYDSAGAPENSTALPSTIVDCTQGDEIKIVRQGALQITDA
jgi:tRNA threonylcarbamoyl adenosine modification protein (Sua5/YciO/YrdC/YwlC family)